MSDARDLATALSNKKIQDNLYEVAIDYLSVGIDPNKVCIFIQSGVDELTTLTYYYMNLVTVSRLQRNPTIKTEIKKEVFNASLSNDPVPGVISSVGDYQLDMDGRELDYYAELERNNIDTLRMNYLRYSIWWIYEDLEIGIDRWTRKKF